MPQSNIPSFLNWEKGRNKKPKDKRNEFLNRKSSEPFITIIPAWKTKKNYALIEINYQRFKLFEHGNIHLKRDIQDLLEWFLYVGPKEYKNEMQDIVNYVNENKKEFKEKWDRQLEVY